MMLASGCAHSAACAECCCAAVCAVLVHQFAVSIAAIACGAAAQQCNVLPVNKLPMSVLPDRPSLVISTVLRESCGGVGSAFGASASTAEIKLNVRKWPKGEIGSEV
eukprot:13745-Heterococcus_DN1.PRE.3